MLIKKFELNCSYEKILMKIQNVQLEEFFFEKTESQNMIPPPADILPTQKNNVREDGNNNYNNLALEVKN